MNKRLQQKKAEHEAWLLKNNVHPTQLKKAKLHRNEFPSYKTKPIDLSNTIVDGGRVHGVMANLHNESPQTVAAILAKASRAIPLWNKGGYMLASESEDLSKVGSLSRRN